MAIDFKAMAAKAAKGAKENKGGGYERIKPGTYIAKVKDFTWFTSKKGNEMYKLDLVVDEVVEGETKEGFQFSMFPNPLADNEMQAEIAMQNIFTVALALQAPLDPEDLDSEEAVKTVPEEVIHKYLGGLIKVNVVKNGEYTNNYLSPTDEVQAIIDAQERGEDIPEADKTPLDKTTELDDDDLPF